MIDSHELRQRDIYLNKLIGFQDTEPVKVITGIDSVKLLWVFYLTGTCWQ